MRLFLQLSLFLSMLALAGCGTTTHLVDIHGKDDDVYFPEWEAVLNLDASPEKGRKLREDTLSIGHSRGAGEFHEYLSGNEYIDIEGVEIFGPGVLKGEAEVDVTYMRFVRRLFISERFEWKFGAGLVASHLEYRGTDGTQVVTVEDFDMGLLGLVGMVYKPHPLFGLEWNAGGYLFDQSPPLRHVDIRGQIVFTPLEEVKLFAGYREWWYDYQEGSGSGIDLEFSGPTAGLTLYF